MLGGLPIPERLKTKPGVMHYRYMGYGLKIDSALELPELGAEVEFEGLADLTLRLGEVSDGDHAGEAKRAEWLAPDHFQFRAEDGTRFAARCGSTISVMLGPGSVPAKVRLYLLGSVFGALLLQRGVLTLHGNAIMVDGDCLICVGDRGAGKSTLAAAFLKRGFDVLADDVVAVDPAGYAVPSFPRMKLWQDAADRLGVSTGGLARVMPEMNKYNVPILRHDPLARAPIRAIYALGKGDGEDVRVIPITGMRRFDALRNNTYRAKYLHGEMLARHLAQCSDLARGVHLADVVRPRVTYSPDQTIDALLDDFRAIAPNPRTAQDKIARPGT